ncbi:CMRF35-like molecule 5 [Clupea harengus]|uniref:CMRF35-like molecule 5 n=1 Tax=Clupea harengus TaxID=7950 RepID=A0A6P8F2G8_CLUHA|nr:CMRF35-like molecule 5 [Clupea harengus]
MKIFACVILLFVSAVSWETDRTLEGSVGGAVDILCKYLTDPESVFLTKMNLSKNVTIIESTQKDQTVIRGRISLYHDSANRFITVAIKNLSREDAGIYRCGTTNYDGNPSYTKINLKVKHAPPTSKSQLTTGSTSAHSTPTGKCRKYISSQHPYR